MYTRRPTGARKRATPEEEDSPEKSPGPIPPCFVQVYKFWCYYWGLCLLTGDPSMSASLSGFALSASLHQPLLPSHPPAARLATTFAGVYTGVLRAAVLLLVARRLSPLLSLSLFILHLFFFLLFFILFASSSSSS